MHFLAREKEEGRGGGAHRGGARRPCDSLVATEVAEVEEDSGDPRKKRWRGGGGVERRRALVPRLAGPVLKQILPAALPVASHGGARGLGRRGRGWVKEHAVPPCLVLVIDDNLYGLTVALSYI